MKRAKTIWCILAALVMLGAILLRSEVREISAVNDVAGISVDPAEKGEYLFGLEIAVPVKEGGFTVKSKVITVRAKNLSDALSQAALQGEYPLTLTHGSLIILGENMVKRDLNKISKILLTDWRGQMRPWMAVAKGCDGVEILRRNEGENLRAGLLSAQLQRAARSGQLQTRDAFSLCSRLLAGETVSLPVVTPLQEGYRISGSVTVKGGDGRG